MEKLLLASYAISDQALTRLANQRAQAVKAWMIGPGHVAASRVFIVAPRLGTQGLTDHGPPTRVDFTIK
jgi:outer membrane protein OmpA-like peptidoglycan-associated protein